MTTDTTQTDTTQTTDTESHELAALRKRMDAHDWLHVMGSGSSYYAGRSVEDSIRTSAASIPGGMALFDKYVQEKRKKYGI